MKKLSYILIVLAAMLLLVACPVPENDPQLPEEKEPLPKIDPEFPDEQEPVPEESDAMVMKVRNSDFSSETVKYALDAFGGKGVLLNPSLVFDRADGEFTVVPLSDEFIEEFKKCDSVEFAVAGLAKDSETGKEDMMILYLRYLPGKKVYILENPKPVNITLKVKDPEYMQTVTGFIWSTPVSDPVKVEKAPGTEDTVLGTSLFPGGNPGVYIYLKVLGEGDRVLAEGSCLVDTLSGDGVCYVEPPSEKLMISLEVKKGEYIIPAGYYALTLDGKFHDDLALSPDGNTVLLESEDFREGQEWRLGVYAAKANEYADDICIGHSEGTLHIEKGTDKIVLEAPESYGRYRMVCDPTFRTDMVFWAIEKKEGEIWVKDEGTYTWNPAVPQKDTYYLPAGEYRLVDVRSDEHPNGSDQGAYSLRLDPIPFAIESGKESGVQADFTDYTAKRMKFTIKHGYEYLGNLKFRVTLMFKSGEKFCGREIYDLVTDRFDYAGGEVTVAELEWWGIPVETESIKLEVLIGGSSRARKTFNLKDMTGDDIYWDATI